MKLENQVVSLEWAKKLKDLGVKQESHFSWFNATDRDDTPSLNRSGHHCPTCSHPHAPYFEEISAFTVGELGDLLPTDISAEVLNKRFPFVENRNATHGSDDEMLQVEEEITSDMKSVFKDLDDWGEDYSDGYGYGIRLSYGRGKKLSYYFNTDEWECNYEVLEIDGDTEADARAKMLCYLIENRLVTV
jgi:hypothetical protein